MYTQQVSSNKLTNLEPIFDGMEGMQFGENQNSKSRWKVLGNYLKHAEHTNNEEF
jgi:hypothetical protein